jgi:ADP-ribose pyrophosphatase YjhB (NUDIX family)
VKEISEEANVLVKARQLYAVKHKAKHDYTQDTRDFYKFFFLCEQMDSASPEAGAETLAAEFFTLQNLPALSLSRVSRKDIETAYLYRDDPLRFTEFD